MTPRYDLCDISQQVRRKVFAAAEGRIDLLITTNPSHVGYLCGYRSVMLDVNRRYRCAVVATAEKAVLVTGAADAAPALEVMIDPALVYRYGQFALYGAASEQLPEACDRFEDALTAAIGSTLKPGQTIGIDAYYAEDAAIIDSARQGARTFPASPLIAKERQTKLPGEIAKIAAISAVADRSIQAAFSAARVGMSELDLSTLISSEIIAAGGIPRFIVVTTGERAALVDAYAGHSLLKPRDLLRIDIGCSLDGYWADTARTAVVAEPTRLQQDRYDALLAGELAQLKIARPGLKASDLFHAAVDRVRDGALPNYQRNHCGHGLGLEGHEQPSLAPSSDTELTEGMVLCVETPYYELGWGGMMVEDSIVLEGNGCRLLTHGGRDLVVI
jgi:Xaa-Pro aminopeptidase